MRTEKSEQGLPPRGKLLLEVSRKLGREFTRQELAAALGQRQLTPWDKQLLGRLVVQGYLTVERQQEAGKNFYRLVYRVSQP